MTRSPGQLASCWATVGSYATPASGPPLCCGGGGGWPQLAASAAAALSAAAAAALSAAAAAAFSGVQAGSKWLFRPTQHW